MRIVVVGAAGHGREVADVVLAAGHELVGFVDDGSPDLELLERRGAALLGAVADPGDARVVLGLGDGAVRASVAERLAQADWAPPLVHPAATLGTDVILGVGSVVAAGARLTTHVELGRHCYVGPNVTIGHDTVCSDFATVLPGATISGTVLVEAGATIGTGANVRQGVLIGAGAMVGAGAVVVSDVAPGTTVVGVPAKPLVR